ncbi:XVIPCD domain-containing protein [Xanthomonas graminis]|uniref:Putative peptidoglycan-binding domain-containing protein n=1 Tax=Xanthomonas graminis pv. phlei TaxID=487906 RepID=A0A0K2ZDT9_9XANT|nr:XVIPCD domain-containing protein [Xanthomonas translucens]CTP83746.1 putative peptidoglycan-binding domain-containing protein [Xanthomonas translucens pv. phlei]
MARIDDRWVEHRQELVDAARGAGIDPSVMVKIAGFESGFNPQARPVATTNPHNNTVRQFDGTMAISSAYGYGQFLDGTWQQMINAYGEKYGIENAANLSRSQTNSPELRQDTRLQAAMLAEFTRENIDRASRYGGGDIAANVYAMHNLGVGDGSRFLQAVHDHPDAKVNTVLSAQVIRGNASLYGDGNITNAQAYAAMGRQMDKYAGYAEGVKNLPPDHQSRHPVQGAPHQTHHSINIFKLEQGQHGQPVEQLQHQLSQLGLTGRDGKPLHPDGDFGPNTRYAVEQFQREHGLGVDGVVGRNTRAALDQAMAQHAPAQQAATPQSAATAPLLSDPSHPQHDLYSGSVRELEKLGERGGFANRQALEQAAGQMAFEAKVSGLDRIDHVLPSKDGRGLIAVQGELNDPAMHRVYVDREQAQVQPLQESTRQMAEEVQRQSQTQQSEARAPAAMTR